MWTFLALVASGSLFGYLVLTSISGDLITDGYIRCYQGHCCISLAGIYEKKTLSIRKVHIFALWAKSSSLYLQVEINLKRYPTPYPEDLKNMVKSVQSLVGKTIHPLNTEKCSSGTNMELHSQDKYEPKWPIAPKEVMLLCLILSQFLPGLIDQCLCNLATKCFL